MACALRRGALVVTACGRDGPWVCCACCARLVASHRSASPPACPPPPLAPSPPAARSPPSLPPSFARRQRLGRRRGRRRDAAPLRVHLAPRHRVALHAHLPPHRAGAAAAGAGAACCSCSCARAAAVLVRRSCVWPAAVRSVHVAPRSSSGVARPRRCGVWGRAGPPPVMPSAAPSAPGPVCLGPACRSAHAHLPLCLPTCPPAPPAAHPCSSPAARARRWARASCTSTAPLTCSMWGTLRS